MPVTSFRINKNTLVNSVSNQSSDYLKEYGRDLIYRKVEEAQKVMLNTFDNHPVTKEIKEGIDAKNISNTLGVGYGNLFSFIGFSAGSDPIGKLREVLERKIYVVFRGQLKRSLDFKYEIRLPSVLAIEGATEMEWSNESWAYAIEEWGIMGVSNYLVVNARSSRSGLGIQVPFEVRKANFQTVPYLSEVFESFIKTLRS